VSSPGLEHNTDRGSFLPSVVVMRTTRRIREPKENNTELESNTLVLRVTIE
jgi:hypothetical protein